MSSGAKKHNTPQIAWLFGSRDLYDTFYRAFMEVSPAGASIDIFFTSGQIFGAEEACFFDQNDPDV